MISAKALQTIIISIRCFYFCPNPITYFGCVGSSTQSPPTENYVEYYIRMGEYPHFNCILFRAAKLFASIFHSFEAGIANMKHFPASNYEKYLYL